MFPSPRGLSYISVIPDFPIVVPLYLDSLGKSLVALNGIKPKGYNMTSTKQIDKKIATFTTNVGKLKNLGHEIAMMIFDHAMAHSDCTRAIKLASAMPNSWQPQIEAWFKAFSPIVVILKNNKCELSPGYKKANPENKAEYWDREGAMNTPFFDIMEEPKADKVYDFEMLLKMVERLSGQIEKKIEEGKVKPEDVLSAQAIATAVKGLKVQRVKAEADNDADKADEAKAA